ncbi:tyrosine-protein kinase receptor TYRO3 [Neosynchiropus ocellatus]
MEALLWILVLWLIPNGSSGGEVSFTRHPSNQTVTQGNAVQLGCAVEGLVDPDIVWIKDGEKLYSTDQMFIILGEQHVETYHSVKSVQQQDAGVYWCEVDHDGLTVSSLQAWITVEGIPHFIREPQDVATFPGAPFNLTCAAVGPPEPVELLWVLGGVTEGDAQPSPSVLQVQGVNSSMKYHCEAKNSRGISVSRTGTVHIKVLPSAPVDLQVMSTDNNVTLSWKPGFTGHSALSTCIVQLSRATPWRRDLPQQKVLVPPHQLVLPGLRSHANYSARVSCVNEVGASPFSTWLQFLTPEAAPSTAPRNLTFELTEKLLTLKWAELQEEELQGNLVAYKVQWTRGGEQQEPLLFKQAGGHLLGGGRFFNSSVQVAACTSVGCGPWSPPVLVLPSAVPVQAHRSHTWVGVLFGLLVLTVLGLLFSMFARRRGKETQFGTAFYPPGADSLVSFTAARSFNRNGGAELPESTLDSLGISDQLKNKLKDVLIPERLLSLGHMLGKGEFGSVREALLKSEDASVQKVAVKVLKSDVTSSGDIEQCLKEAAYMKDFHHPNVIQLIGVSLHRRPGQRLPVPMVVLPFMKHGDLHTFLLLSRLGEQPFDLSLQTLVQFMLDVARGMEYLSSRSIIHRDLAARNCMLDENMTVCVADFGLSKKIYSGDYYRQGSVSKLPVKWIALESLADNVYTTQSDVWAFGVTMWEVMTRGQTPYPGVENSEIYEYLIKGERLKKPPDCREDIYDIMHSCWSPVPKCRPSFQHLVSQLEGLWLSLSPAPPPKDTLLYVNLEGSGEAPTAAGSSWGAPWLQMQEDEEKDWLMVGSGAALAIGGDYRYIIGPSASEEEEEHRESLDMVDGEVDDDDAVINV